MPDVWRGLPVVTCPYCRHANDAHTAVTGHRTPEPGDLSVCWTCLRPSVFTADGGVRKLTDAELAGPKGDAWRAAVAAIGQVRGD